MNETVSTALPFTPIIIIGAGRSGTNILRDSLVQINSFATWPCDEINPIWRHGNLNHPDDAIPPSRATPAIKQFIRNAFFKIWKKQGQPNFIVEKTCANSLRVPFVDTVLPESRYIHIVRDGYDVVASAQKRWYGELEIPRLPYFLAKARYSPLSDLPRYAISAISARLAVYAGLRPHLKSWGPKFPDMHMLSDAPIEELIARQWAACVTESDGAFADIDANRVFQLKYEDFVTDAATTIRHIMDWLGADVPEETVKQAAMLVRQGSVGKGRGKTAKLLSQDIQAILQSPLKTHGYTD